MADREVDTLVQRVGKEGGKGRKKNPPIGGEVIVISGKSKGKFPEEKEKERGAFFPG